MNNPPDPTHRQEIREELKVLSPDLEKKLSVPKDVQIPASYLPQLQERILHRILKEESSHKRNKPFFLTPVGLRSIAASFAFLLLVGSLWWWTKKDAPISEAFDQLSMEEIESYLDDRIHLIDDGLLFDYSLMTSSESFFIDENAIHDYLDENPPSLEDISGDDHF